MRLMHDILELAQHSEKPRKSGLTMIVDRGWTGVNTPYMEAYHPYVDLAKSTAQCLWVDEKIVKKNIGKYRDYGVDVQIGGIPYEVAVLQGKQKEYIKRNKEIGANVIEVENHAADLSIKQMQDEIHRLKDEGFIVVGEIGAKWVDHDKTRKTRNAVDVGMTVEQMKIMLDAGADHVYWEGMVVRALIGNKLENLDGQKQVLDVVNQVGKEHIIIEMWSARGHPNTPLWGWLVSQFGTEVNLANIKYDEVSSLESIRRGCSYDPAHPYLRWLAGGKPTANWWEMPSPDYKVDLPG